MPFSDVILLVTAYLALATSVGVVVWAFYEVWEFFVSMSDFKNDN